MEQWTGLENWDQGRSGQRVDLRKLKADKNMGGHRLPYLLGSPSATSWIQEMCTTVP